MASTVYHVVMALVLLRSQRSNARHVCRVPPSSKDWSCNPGSGDRLFSRQAPGYETVRELPVTCEMLAPRSYGMCDERLADIIRRFGELTLNSHAAGTCVKRLGRTLPRSSSAL